MLNKEEVVWAYRLLLGREPENEQVVEAGQKRYATKVNLVRAMLSSPEFAARDIKVKKNSPTAVPPLQVEWEVSSDLIKIISDRTARTWNSLGETKPHWSVLSAERFLPEQIRSTEDEFFATGGGDLEIIRATIQRAGRRGQEFATIFEYGCGLGRVTHHLAKAFSRVVACDISTSHLEIGRAALRERGIKNAEMIRAEPPNFGMTEPFDIWFSRIVLQHNSPPIMALILKRALSLLRSQGLAIFQLPTYAPNYRFAVAEYLAKSPVVGTFEMHMLPQSVVFDLARRADCKVIEVVEDDAAGTPTWRSNSFVLQKL